MVEEVVISKEGLILMSEKLKHLKSVSKEVANWIEVNNELMRIKRSISSMNENSEVYKMREKYIEILNKRLDTMKVNADVKEYTEICNDMLKILSGKSTFMKSIKKENPELYSWIALNKKRAFYERKIASEPSNKQYLSELNEVQTELINFREKHSACVDLWEELYNLKLVAKY